jgi:hypothetical protein
MGQKSNPPPAPFLLYLISTKTKSPKTAEISRPFQGFSLKTKGYVEKCLLPITFLFSGKNFFLKPKTTSVRDISATPRLTSSVIANKVQRGIRIRETLVPRMCLTRQVRFGRRSMGLSVPPRRHVRVSLPLMLGAEKVTDLKAFTKKIKCDIFSSDLRSPSPRFQKKLRRLKG